MTMKKLVLILIVFAVCFISCAVAEVLTLPPDLKCIEEENAGNTEFRTAKKTIWASLLEMRGRLPELAAFLDDFLEDYGKTLDELAS